MPHTVLLAPGLVIDKVYVGYWFWGTPVAHQLWADLRELFAGIKADYDPTTAEARAALAGHASAGGRAVRDRGQRALGT